MAERRYSDEDVRRILSLAAEAETAAAAEDERAWTLGDIERIGVEAGLAPQTIAAAAVALERRQLPERERASLLGMPVAVSHAVPLERRLSDDDWDRLVAQLRDTFAARGRVQVSGARREWRVGNLRVTHEPAGSGALLEMRTRKGNARAFLQLGVLLLVVAAMSALPASLGGSADSKLAAVSWAALIASVLLFAVGLLRLPSWAKRRARQFEALAAYARQIASA